MNANTTSSAFTSVLAQTKMAGMAISPNMEFLFGTLTAPNIWTVLLTVVAMCVIYDQGMHGHPSS
jgi:C-22 sterol desaturase